jgi:hypothetical protein
MNEQLQSFIYILLRDYLPAGIIEKIMRDHVEKTASGVDFCNHYLADYAAEITDRLMGFKE